MNKIIEQCINNKEQVRYYLISAPIINHCIHPDKKSLYAKKLLECSRVLEELCDVYFIIKFLTRINIKRNILEHHYDDISAFLQYFNELSDERKEWIKDFAKEYLTTTYREFLFEELNIGSTQKT